MDANFNRAKEGLRVCEDVCRFILNAPAATREYKKIRHQLTAAAKCFSFFKLIRARNIEQDVGRRTFSAELKRKDIRDIFYANSQRMKESVRVLEEFTKLSNRSSSETFKKIRYKVYALEKKIITKL